MNARTERNGVAQGRDSSFDALRNAEQTNATNDRTQKLHAAEGQTNKFYNEGVDVHSKFQEANGANAILIMQLQASITARQQTESVA